MAITSSTIIIGALLVVMAIIIQDARAGYGYRSSSYGYRSPSYGYRRQRYGYRRPSYSYRTQSYGYRRPSYGTSSGVYSSVYNSHQTHQISCVGLPNGTLIGDTTTHCRRFFTCVNNLPVAMYCPALLTFDSRTGTCTLAILAQCTYVAITPVTATVAPVIPTVVQPLPVTSIPTVVQPLPVTSIPVIGR